AAREAVGFEQRNLAADDPDLWPPARLDIVFCRNVVMYFAPEAARALIARIAAALQPGGYLFLGHAETLRGVSDAFHLCHTHGTFYYRRKADRAAAAETPRAGGAATVRGEPRGAAWFAAIGRASERVAVLAAPRAQPRDVGRRPVRSEPRWDVAPALDL